MLVDTEIELESIDINLHNLETYSDSLLTLHKLQMEIAEKYMLTETSFSKYASMLPLVGSQEADDEEGLFLNNPLQIANIFPPFDMDKYKELVENEDDVM